MPTGEYDKLNFADIQDEVDSAVTQIKPKFDEVDFKNVFSTKTLASNKARPISLRNTRRLAKKKISRAASGIAALHTVGTILSFVETIFGIANKGLTIVTDKFPDPALIKKIGLSGFIQALFGFMRTTFFVLSYTVFIIKAWDNENGLNSDQKRIGTIVNLILYASGFIINTLGIIANSSSAKESIKKVISVLEVATPMFTSIMSMLILMIHIMLAILLIRGTLNGAEIALETLGWVNSFAGDIDGILGMLMLMPDPKVQVIYTIVSGLANFVLVSGTYAGLMILEWSTGVVWSAGLTMDEE